MFTVDDVLEKHYPQLADKPLLGKSLSFMLKHLLHEQEISHFGAQYPHLQGLEFIEQVLEYFNFSYSVRDNERERIPTTGPVVIIANHPIGSLDGLALIKMVSEIRPDIKAVANEMLMAIAPMHPLLLPVNNMQGGTCKEDIHNIRQHLQNQGALIMFPAGEVSRLRPQGVRDGKWQSGFMRMASSVKAPILPIFIDGKNSPLFYGVSMVYKPLATMLLVQEMFNQKRNHIPMRIGQQIPYNAYGNLPISLHQRTKLMKKHLYRIGFDKRPIFATQNAIAPPEDRRDLCKAIKRDCELLGSTGDGKSIYLYRYAGSSPILREIGRLREIAFRAVGEGSNRRRDIDQYDTHYFHLLLWDNDDLEIAGAYRFGDAAKLTQARGLNGLYSASLFDYHKNMRPYLEQGLELGRSFVQPQYWGKRSLDYLWYGIGAFLARNPQYRYLFGPVSISNSLPKPAKDLLVSFYQTHFGNKQNLASAKAVYTPASEMANTFKGEDYKTDFSTLKHMMANMEAAIPTLFKQYTEICTPGGAQFLSFSVDADFNDCIDGLILVDINKLKTKKRQRYIDSHTENKTASNKKLESEKDIPNAA